MKDARVEEEGLEFSVLLALFELEVAEQVDCTDKVGLVPRAGSFVILTKKQPSCAHFMRQLKGFSS